MPLNEVKSGIRYGLEPKILFLLYAVMLFKTVLDTSGAAHSLFDQMQSMGMPNAVILILLPLLIGFSTGLSSAMVGISIPLLTPFIVTGGSVDGAALLLAYGAGGIGYLLSPLHLCLVLSAEYYHARLASVYRYLVPPALAVLVGLALLHLVLG
jgi:integral membrane protein (TIGR00529 family)